MTIEDQVAVLFARENPVPSLDLLDPIDPVDIGALRDESERSGAMSEVKTFEPKREDSNRRRFAPGLALAGVIVVVAVAAFALANRNPTPVASPVEIATSFLDARNSHDAEAMTSLLADDVVWVPGGELLMDATNVPAAVEFERITGADYEFTCANDGPSQVRCPYTLENHLSRALGFPPRELAPAYYLFGIEDGQIVRVENIENGQFRYGDTVVAFYEWLSTNHPEAGDPPDDNLGILEPEQLALWEQYVPEFVASLED
ncbi:MAG: hypothetical protein ABW021_01815 [Acidimicrobiia bacterium]